MLVDLDLTRIDPSPKRVNISLPGSLLSQIDAYAEARHLSRSGFLAKAAKEAIQAER
jgi:metal-responsive CopG/Arc/MetJ family transcriptional regulator